MRVEPEPLTLAREREAFFPTYDRFSIGTVTHAKGCYIYTEDGSKYLDAIAGLGVNALGHSDPELVQAVQEQASKYMHLSNLYLQEPQVRLAEKLKALSGWDRVFFSNSGTEAVEAAIKLVRKYQNNPAKTEVIGVANAFHGRTYGALSVMDKAKYRDGYGPFLPKASSTSDNSVAGLAARVSDATAAIIIEPIQGEGGIVEVSREFVEALHSLRDRFGFLIIADEIQSGIGRTGKFFAYEHYGLKPDVVVIAKAIGGGLPLGGVLSTSAIASTFSAGVHGTTFGGNAVACAAGIVVLERLEQGLLAEVAERGERLKARLQDIQKKYPSKVVEVRGKGYMLGMELRETASNGMSSAKGLHSALLARKIISNVTAGNVLRLLPPLIFEEAEIELLASQIEDILSRPELP